MALGGTDIELQNQQEHKPVSTATATDGTEVKVTPSGRASYVKTVLDPGAASSSDVASTSRMLQHAEKIKRMLRNRGG